MSSPPAANRPPLDPLRAAMTVREDRAFSADYLDPEKRSIANAVQVFFRDGSATVRTQVEYSIGHRRRRAEGKPFLLSKVGCALGDRLRAERAENLVALFGDRAQLDAMPVAAFMDRFTVAAADPAVTSR